MRLSLWLFWCPSSVVCVLEQCACSCGNMLCWWGDFHGGTAAALVSTLTIRGRAGRRRVGRVWPSLTSNVLRRWFKLALSEFGITTLDFHGLRHGWAGWQYLVHLLTPAEIQSLENWKSLQTMQFISLLRGSLRWLVCFLLRLVRFPSYASCGWTIGWSLAYPEGVPASRV